MRNQNLSTVTTDLIACYGNTARNMIRAYRLGNQRVARFIDDRWDSALQASASQLRSEVRKNALAAQRAVSGMYIKGITVTSDRADVVVDKALELADKGVRQIATTAGAFEQRTGVTSLHVLAKASVPAVNLVSGLAGKLEQGSSKLANTVAGKSTAVRTTAKRAGPRKTASDKRSGVKTPRRRARPTA